MSFQKARRVIVSKAMIPHVRSKRFGDKVKVKNINVTKEKASSD